MRDPRTRASGFTLIEMMVSTVVLAILVQAILQGALAMAGSAEFGQKRQRMVVQLQRVLDKMAMEITDSSVDVDPNTGFPYMTVAGNVHDQSLTFKRIVDFGSNGTEISPIWSSDIVYHRVNNQLMRTQDGVDEMVLNGVAQVDVDVLANGRVNLTVGIDAPRDGTAPTTIIRNATVSTVY